MGRKKWKKWARKNISKEKRWREEVSVEETKKRKPTLERWEKEDRKKKRSY